VFGKTLKRSGQRLVAGEAARACQNGANLRQAAHRRERLRTLTAAAAPARPGSSQAVSSLGSSRRARACGGRRDRGGAYGGVARSTGRAGSRESSPCEIPSVRRGGREGAGRW